MDRYKYKYKLNDWLVRFVRDRLVELGVEVERASWEFESVVIGGKGGLRSLGWLRHQGSQRGRGPQSGDDISDRKRIIFEFCRTDFYDSVYCIQLQLRGDNIKPVININIDDPSFDPMDVVWLGYLVHVANKK